VYAHVVPSFMPKESRLSVCACRPVIHAKGVQTECMRVSPSFTPEESRLSVCACHDVVHAKGV
jgi:hypothetical protein